MGFQKWVKTKLLEESFTLPPDVPDLGRSERGARYSLFITAKKYRVQELEAFRNDSDAITVLALHSTSFHKETWEPTLEALFQALVMHGSGKVKIREVWAVDCPNHGHAGVLNRDLLESKEFATDCGCEHYAVAIHRFLLSAPRTFGIDFSERKLVGLGHSLGANALLLLQRLEPIYPFLSLIIVEPMISAGDGHDLDQLRKRLVKSAQDRKSEWTSREAALLFLKVNPGTMKWDEQVLKAFVNHAIAESPSGNTVRLACTPQQERAMYTDVPGATQPVQELTRLCPVLPIHLVLGLINDFIPRATHERLLDPASGRTYASVVEIPEVGHLIPQEIPNKLGNLVYKILAVIMERQAKL